MDEMIQDFLDEWTSIVKKDDTVYHLGDFALGIDLNAIAEVINRLTGNIHLILGNHDTPNKVAFYQQFSKIKMFGSINIEGYLLTHQPVHPSLLGERTVRSEGYGDQFCCHGHNHKGTIDDPRYFNMCWDVREKEDGRHILPFAEVKERIQKQISEYTRSFGGTD
jgi:calcineurin-like phosphoesterase family protein